MKKAKEFRTLPEQELKERLLQMKKELLKLRVGVLTGAHGTESSKIRQLKRAIALISTLQLERKGGIRT